MNDIPCSVCILTHNSAATLGRAIESVRNCSDIIVCDGNSTDETLAIARRYNARIVAQDRRYLDSEGRILDFSGVRNVCVAEALYDWVLHLDADEYASGELVQEIARIAATAAPAVYWVPRKYVADGTVIERSVSYPNRQARFYHRRATRGFRKPIHERVEPSEGFSFCTLTNPILVPVDLMRGGYRGKTRRYIALELDRQAPLTLRTTARIVSHAVKVSLLYTARLAMLLFKRGPRMPLSHELRVIEYQLALSLAAIGRFIKRA